MHFLHLLRTDIRHFRWLLAGWVLVQAMSTVYGGTSPFAATDSQLGAPIAVLGFVLTLARWIGLVFMVPLLLQTHPAAASDAFWLTRPIPWRTLLLSKGILIGSVCVALPALFEAILMVVYRIPPRDMILVVIQALLLQGLLVALLLALAATTRGLAGFALAAGGLLLSLGVVLNVSVIFAMRAMTDEPMTYVVAPLGASGGSPVLLLFSLIAAFALFVAVQYQSRSRGAAMSIGALAMVVAVALQFVWPSSHRVRAAPAWTERETALRLAVHAPTLQFVRTNEWASSSRPHEWFTGSLRVRVSGIEKNWLGSLRLIESRLQFENGSTVATSGNNVISTVQFENADQLPDNMVMRDVLGVSRVSPFHWDGTDAPDWVSAIILKDADLRPRLGSVASYRGRFFLDLGHLQIVGVAPLRSGGEIRDGGDRIVIEGVQLRGSRAQLRLRKIATTTFFEPNDHHQQFFLRNARTSEAIEGSENSLAMTAGGLHIAGVAFGGANAVGFSLHQQLFDFPGYAPVNSSRIDLTTDWLSEADLVIVRRASRASVERTLDIPRVEIVEVAPSRGPR